VVFGVAGALVPIVAIITDDLATMFSTIASIAAITLLVIAFGPDPGSPVLKAGLPVLSNKKNGGSKGLYPWVSNYYVTEILLGQMVFWMVSSESASILILGQTLITKRVLF